MEISVDLYTSTERAIFQANQLHLKVMLHNAGVCESRADMAIQHPAHKLVTCFACEQHLDTCTVGSGHYQVATITNRSFFQCHFAGSLASLDQAESAPPMKKPMLNF